MKSASEAVRAWIGRMVLSCIDAEGNRRFSADTADIDFQAMTDPELSDFLHGRLKKPAPRLSGLDFGIPGYVVTPVGRRNS